MKTTLSRGLLAAIAFATLTGRPADAGTVEQILTIPTNARSVSFDPFNPAFGHLDFVAIVLDATFQPISRGGFYNDPSAQGVPLTLTGKAGFGLNFGPVNADNFAARGTYNFGPLVVNPGDSVTLTTPVSNVSSIDVLTADQWAAIGGTSDVSHLNLALDVYRFISGSGVPNYGAGDAFEVDGGDYSGTAKVYYFFNMPETSLSDVPLLIPEPSTIVSAGIAAVTGLGLTCRRRRRKSAD